MENHQIILPKAWKFKTHEYYDFDKLLNFFNWEINNQDVTIDFSQCLEANYQALSLFVLYAWHLRRKNCHISFKYNENKEGASQMWKKMGSPGLFNVLGDNILNFKGSYDKPLFAIRRNSLDFSDAMRKTESYAQTFNIEYKKTLDFIIAELLYNTLEHGYSLINIPSLIQFAWYQQKGEISFIIADIGIGIKQHLRQSYPQIEDDVSAIKLALEPKISGTFIRNTPYAAKDNAGFGLYSSSKIINKLRADMHIVSGSGVVHISPTDITDKKLDSHWPGTLVYVTIKLSKSKDISLQKMLFEFRTSANNEILQGEKQDQKRQFYVSVRNYCGRYAEEKSTAIMIRDTKLIPAIDEGKSLLIDFDEIALAPHSFLSALLAVPIRQYGMQAYKNIKIINADSVIRETIDYILDENTN
ncbi:MAG: DUF4325 domain-containing protein [Dolichospermum sp.]